MVADLWDRVLQVHIEPSTLESDVEPSTLVSREYRPGKGRSWWTRVSRPETKRSSSGTSRRASTSTDQRSGTSLWRGTMMLITLPRGAGATATRPDSSAG